MTEQEIITRYGPLLWKHVHSFKGRTTMKSIPDEDLIQTAQMAFLQSCVELVNLKQQGYNSRGAAEALNRSKGWVSQKLNKLHQLYEE